MGGRGTVEHLRGMHVIRTGMQMGERERERGKEELLLATLTSPLFLPVSFR